MTISLYSASVPVFRHMLGSLDHILARGQAHAAERGFDPAALTTYRLAPDMLPFTRQVQIACDAAKNATARVSEMEAPKFPDEEQTFDELRARVRQTRDWLATVPADRIDGREAREITFPVGRDATRTMRADDYLRLWALPNLFFHITTAYAILRHNGVDLGKRDFLLGAAAR